jgi:hypothetical protein
MIVIIQDNEFVTEPIKIIDQLSEATTKEKLFFMRTSVIKKP